MKVNSTGLGKTTLTSHISQVAPNDEGGLLMKIEATQPVHWHITCQMDSGDVRAAIKMVLRPSVVARVVMMALGWGTRVPKGDVAPKMAGKAS